MKRFYRKGRREAPRPQRKQKYFVYSALLHDLRDQAISCCASSPKPPETLSNVGSPKEYYNSIDRLGFPGEVDPAVLREFAHEAVGERPAGGLGVKNADIGAGKP